MKTCARCKRILPAESFRANPKMRSGLDSWCRDCKKTYQRERRYRDYAKFEQIIRHESEKDDRRADPIFYSRAVCEHVASYTERAIARFERNTGLEAPPYLTALRDLANQFSREHPDELRVIACKLCGSPIGTRTKRNFCDDCQRDKQRARDRRAYDPDRNRRHMAKRTTEQIERYNANRRKARYLAKR